MPGKTWLCCEQWFYMMESVLTIGWYAKSNCCGKRLYPSLALLPSTWHSMPRFRAWRQCSAPLRQGIMCFKIRLDRGLAATSSALVSIILARRQQVLKHALRADSDLSADLTIIGLASKSSLVAYCILMAIYRTHQTGKADIPPQTFSGQYCMRSQPELHDAGQLRRHLSRKAAPVIQLGLLSTCVIFRQES